VSALLALTGLALGGCGGAVHIALTAQRADGITVSDPLPGTTRFNRPEFAISFDYPAGMTEHSDLNIATRVGASSTRDVDVAEALADHDMIVVERAGSLVGAPAQPLDPTPTRLVVHPALLGPLGGTGRPARRRVRGDRPGQHRRQPVPGGLPVAQLRAVLRGDDGEHSVRQPAAQPA